MHDVADAQGVRVPGVSGARKDVKAEPELTDPSEALVVERLQDARFDAVESDVAVNIIEDDFFERS